MKRLEHNIETGEMVEIDLTDEEISERQSEANAYGWQNLRRERNALLTASDWTVLSDSPTSTAAWKVYRQALRDLPANTTDPLNVVWPVPPA